MTPLEKLHRLLEVKKEVERDAVYQFQHNPNVRAIVEELKKKNAGQPTTN